LVNRANKVSYKDEFRAKKAKKLLVKVSLLLAGFFILAGGMVYFLFFSGVFKVKEIKITGLAEAESAQLKLAVKKWLDDGFLFFKRGANSVFLSKDNLASNLLNQSKELESLEIKNNSIHGLDIEVSQRKPGGIWCFGSGDKPLDGTQSKCFYFDKEGVAYQEAARSRGFIIVSVVDMKNTQPEIGSKVASEDWYKNIILAKDLLPRAGINISEILIKSDSFDEFEVRTPAGWVIMFSLSTNIQKQISALNTFLKEKMTPEKIKALNYVDLRIQDRIYYK
jgi:hypothetical protein